MSGQEKVGDLQEISKEHTYAEGKVGSGRKILGIKVLKGVLKKNKLLGQDSSCLRKSNFSGAREKSERLQGRGAGGS